MGAVCTFFGHRDCPSAIKQKLREVLIDLIENHSVEMFYVGNQGQFDRLVRAVLRELQMAYPQIGYAILLAYMPSEKARESGLDFSDTMLPEGIENIPKHFAISWRNNWMLKQSDYVVTYITHSWGGAARFAERAQRQGKSIINLAEASSGKELPQWALISE